MSTEVSEVRRLMSTRGWFQWVTDEEAAGAADVIIRSDDPAEILRQLGAGEIRRLAAELPEHKKQELLDDLARALKADTMTAEERTTLRESFTELGKAFGYDTVLASLNRNGTVQTQVEFVKAFVSDTLSSHVDVSHGTLLDITKMLEGLPANQRGEVIALLSDEQLRKWASEIGAWFGNLSGEEKRHLFDVLTASLDPQQLGRVARAVGVKADEALKEFTQAILAGTPEQKVAYVNAVAGTLSLDEVKSLADPGLVAGFIQVQNLDDFEGYKRAVTAFASLDAAGISALAREHPQILQRFSLRVQAHQDWYEQLTIPVMRLHSKGGRACTSVDSADVKFNKEQLNAMREAFSYDDGLITNGELLLAYPDRVERNEKVTGQYHELSSGMAQIVGADYLNWCSLAVWASDGVGRVMVDPLAIAAGTVGFADLVFWFSHGNTTLASEMAPVFKHFIDTYGDGSRGVSFEQFWQSLGDKYQGRGLSYLEGVSDPRGVDHSGADSKLDVKNAFKAYYEAMLLNDKQNAGQATPADKQRRGQLMLYGNVLVGMQEQRTLQRDLENSLKVLNITNPRGGLARKMDVHIPSGKLDLDRNVPNEPAGLTDLDASFTTVDGRQINLGTELVGRLNALDGDSSPGDENEGLRIHTATSHWERFDERIPWIFHFFAAYHTDPSLLQDPRENWGSRAEALDTQPEPLIRLG